MKSKHCILSNFQIVFPIALRNGINRKNADVLEKAIQDAKQSSLSDKLNNYIREGEQMLQEADNNSMFILEMKRTTISEVHRYKKPKPVMYDVMKATYILLGEKPESLTVRIILMISCIN